VPEPERRRFPPPWTVEEPDPKLDRPCHIVRDANRQALAHVYFDGDALQNSALIGLIGAKLSAAPPSIATAIVA
jgi:hypothetical protein